MNEDRTLFIASTTSAPISLDDRLHFLELVGGGNAGHRYIIGPAGACIGRTLPAEIVIADPMISRTHCRIDLYDEHLRVTDLNSTNGTFLDGVRLAAPTFARVGAILQVGEQVLKHEWRTRGEILKAEELDRDLQKARSYVHALLPQPLTQGPVRADWLYQPSAKLGGDAFGYSPISNDRFACYIIDVAGHGAGAAMHSVALMNVLRQRALPDTDMSQPSKVLSTLNAMFEMERHADMYFTMWYGVYNLSSRRLDFASAGHHPAYLVPPGRAEALPLRTRSPMIGAFLGAKYIAGSVDVPPQSSLYLFSDGVFEIVTIDGVEWSLNDFVHLVSGPPVPGLSEPRRLLQSVDAVARPGGFDDDFTLVVLTFD